MRLLAAGWIIFRSFWLRVLQDPLVALAKKGTVKGAAVGPHRRDRLYRAVPYLSKVP